MCGRLLAVERPRAALERERLFKVIDRISSSLAGRRDQRGCRRRDDERGMGDRRRDRCLGSSAARRWHDRCGMARRRIERRPSCGVRRPGRRAGARLGRRRGQAASRFPRRRSAARDPGRRTTNRSVGGRCRAGRNFASHRHRRLSHHLRGAHGRSRRVQSIGHRPGGSPDRCRAAAADGAVSGRGPLAPPQGLHPSPAGACQSGGRLLRRPPHKAVEQPRRPRDARTPTRSDAFCS